MSVQVVVMPGGGPGDDAGLSSQDVNQLQRTFSQDGGN